MSDFFVSYAGADRDRAQAVAAELQARGQECERQSLAADSSMR
ncbi:MAG TPA: hypothetical protein PLA97_08095 [Rubrivivax sp.]|nr:hypothetical protein [Rubrivivax sp.]